MYTEMHFYISHKTQKAPPKRSLKFVSKNANGLLCGLPRSRRLLAMTIQGLTAPQGERSDRACTGIAEPKGCYTAGVESTVYRGTLVLLRTMARVAGKQACT